MGSLSTGCVCLHPRTPAPLPHPLLPLPASRSLCALGCFFTITTTPSLSFPPQAGGLSVGFVGPAGERSGSQAQGECSTSWVGGLLSPSSWTPVSPCPLVCPVSSLALSASRSPPPFLPGYILSPTSNLWGQNGATSLVSLPPVPSVEFPFLSHSLGLGVGLVEGGVRPSPHLCPWPALAG